MPGASEGGWPGERQDTAEDSTGPLNVVCNLKLKNTSLLKCSILTLQNMVDLS